MKPLVSIVINNYNYAAYVGSAIESALQQSYSNTEIVVVDDGSTDSSRAVISRFGDFIKPIFKNNGGQASAFNVGFAESRGDIVCFLDSDDVYQSTKLERVVDALADCPTGWCFHNIQWADANLKPLSTPGIPYPTGIYDFRSEWVSGRCAFAPPATSGLSFSRNLLARLMPVPDSIKITSDNYLKYSSLAIEAGYYIAEPLAIQRIHGDNAYTGRKDATLRANVQLMTASGLRSKFPALRSVCNRMFANGLVDKWHAGATAKSVSTEMWQYLGDLPFAEKTETLARIAVKAIRRSARRLAVARP